MGLCLWILGSNLVDCSQATRVLSGSGLITPNNPANCANTGLMTPVIGQNGSSSSLQVGFIMTIMGFTICGLALIPGLFLLRRQIEW